MTHTDPTRSQALVVPADRLQTSIVLFAKQSPIGSCASIDDDWSDGVVTIRPLWPVDGFSSGEQAAWRVLCSLIDGDLRRLIERSDADTVAALIASLSSIHFELVSA